MPDELYPPATTNLTPRAAPPPVSATGTGSGAPAVHATLTWFGLARPESAGGRWAWALDLSARWMLLPDAWAGSTNTAATAMHASKTTANRLCITTPLIRTSLQPVCRSRADVPRPGAGGQVEWGERG